MVPTLPHEVSPHTMNKRGRACLDEPSASPPPLASCSTALPPSSASPALTCPLDVTGAGAIPPSGQAGGNSDDARPRKMLATTTAAAATAAAAAATSSTSTAASQTDPTPPLPATPPGVPRQGAAGGPLLLPLLLALPPAVGLRHLAPLLGMGDLGRLSRTCRQALALYRPRCKQVRIQSSGFEQWWDEAPCLREMARGLAAVSGATTFLHLEVHDDGPAAFRVLPAALKAVRATQTDTRLLSLCLRQGLPTGSDSFYGLLAMLGTLLAQGRFPWLRRLALTGFEFPTLEHEAAYRFFAALAQPTAAPHLTELTVDFARLGAKSSAALAAAVHARAPRTDKEAHQQPPCRPLAVLRVGDWWDHAEQPQQVLWLRLLPTLRSLGPCERGRATATDADGLTHQAPANLLGRALAKVPALCLERIHLDAAAAKHGGPNGSPAYVDVTPVAWGLREGTLPRLVSLTLGGFVVTELGAEALGQAMARLAARGGNGNGNGDNGSGNGIDTSTSTNAEGGEEGEVAGGLRSLELRSCWLATPKAAELVVRAVAEANGGRCLERLVLSGCRGACAGLADGVRRAIAAGACPRLRVVAVDCEILGKGSGGGGEEEEGDLAQVVLRGGRRGGRPGK